MKNRIVFENNDKEEYNVLFKVEVSDENYIVYTKDEVNSDGETLVYAASYGIKNGKQVLMPIDNEEILEYIDGVLLQVQRNMNKEIGDK